MSAQQRLRRWSSCSHAGESLPVEYRLGSPCGGFQVTGIRPWGILAAHAEAQHADARLTDLTLTARQGAERAAMRLLGLVIGALVILGSAISFAAPDLRLSLERSVITPAGLDAIAALRIAIGLVFVLAAPVAWPADS